MEIRELTQADIDQAQQEALYHLKAFNEVRQDDSKGKEELAQASIEAFRALARVNDVTQAFNNQLITQGQILADRIQGKPQGAKN